MLGIVLRTATERVDSVTQRHTAAVASRLVQRGDLLPSTCGYRVAPDLLTGLQFARKANATATDHVDELLVHRADAGERNGHRKLGLDPLVRVLHVQHPDLAEQMKVAVDLRDATDDPETTAKVDRRLTEATERRQFDQVTGLRSAGHQVHTFDGVQWHVGLLTAADHVQSVAGHHAGVLHSGRPQAERCRSQLPAVQLVA